MLPKVTLYDIDDLYFNGETINGIVRLNLALFVKLLFERAIEPLKMQYSYRRVVSYNDSRDRNNDDVSCA